MPYAQCDRGAREARGLGDVYKRQIPVNPIDAILLASEPVEGSGGELKLPPESFAICLLYTSDAADE